MNKKEESKDAKKAEDKKVEDVKKEDFVDDKGKVDANKYNQALRKAREAEARARELEEEKEALKNQPPEKVIQPKVEKKEEDEEDDDFWGDDKKKENNIDKTQNYDPELIKQLVDEKIKPFVESENHRVKIEKKKARESFYDSHPEYLQDPDKWAELLDELGSSIKPSGDYYQDLEKAHRIIGGEDVNQAQIEQKKREFASDSSYGGGNASSQQNKSGLTEMDKKVMEGTGVSEDVIKKMKELEKDGLLSLEF